MSDPPRPLDHHARRHASGSVTSRDQWNVRVHFAVAAAAASQRYARPSHVAE
jgi:hypothetical protein